MEARVSAWMQGYVHGGKGVRTEGTWRTGAWEPDIDVLLRVGGLEQGGKGGGGEAGLRRPRAPSRAARCTLRRARPQTPPTRRPQCPARPGRRALRTAVRQRQRHTAATSHRSVMRPAAAAVAASPVPMPAAAAGTAPTAATPRRAAAVAVADACAPAPAPP
eukprot:359133-Chlamydomonas_euryale.AAC.2